MLCLELVPPPEFHANHFAYLRLGDQLESQPVCRDVRQLFLPASRRARNADKRHSVES